VTFPSTLPLTTIVPMSSTARIEALRPSAPPVLLSMPATIEPPMKTLAMRWPWM
jgi:hypothetical protein